MAGNRQGDPPPRNVFFLYETPEIAFIIQTQQVRREGIETYSLVAFWPHEDYAESFNSKSTDKTPERQMRECLEATGALNSLFESGTLKTIH
jgi:hypothetical protein